jgi:hypothetical protein
MDTQAREERYFICGEFVIRVRSFQVIKWAISFHLLNFLLFGNIALDLWEIAIFFANVAL